ncbi:MAG: methyltransferase domain-containing protein [Deltaproteobacteria bacterium]|jgi:ubiquinone/menaquinone biosynthesis C-methylase UbiE|nr:methyltransferase domain-containing protein [Deltaproteobacteria bacterium]MBW2480983.1 methyltransferase domain-containing protein [Deltaproteobacteria bacterium]
MEARVPQSEIPGVYDKLSKTYDIWGKLAETRARNRAIELAEIADGQKILEVAVGTGLGFYEIVQRNPNGTNIGVDISRGMLQKAEKRLGQLTAVNYELKVGNAFHLEEEDGRFDLLVNNYMFDLIAFDQMDTILEEFKRVLKKGGKLILVNMTAGESIGSGIYSLIYRLSPKAFGGCRGVKLKDKLHANGFEVKTREYCQQLWFPSEVILACK